MSVLRISFALATLLAVSACSGGGGGGGGAKDDGPLQDLEAVYASAITVDLTWTNVADAATFVLVKRSTSHSGPFDDLGTIPGDSTEYRDEDGIELGTKYYYKVFAVGGPDDGGFSKVATPGDPPPIPEEPEPADSISTTIIGPSEIDVSWVHSGDNVLGFRLERLLNFDNGPGNPDFSYVQIADLPADARLYHDTCLSPEAPYKYRVTAYNETGATAVLETLPNTITPSATVGVSTAPFNLQAIQLNADSYRIQWENGCTQAQGILPEVRVNGGAYQNVLGPGLYFAPDATYFFYVDLPQGNTYEFKLSAFNDISGISSSATATAVGPSAPPPPTGGWIGVYADYDNTRAVTDLGPNSNAAVYKNGNLMAGCFWSFNTFLGMQDFICYSSALHFPMSGTTTSLESFNLAGKTIDQAVLVLSVSSVSLQPTNFNLHAIASSWSTNTLNGNQSLDLYTAGGSINGSPLGYGNYGIDVTTIVQNWASGTATNNGVLLEDAEYVFPYASIIRTSFFWSTDNFNANANNKPTLWVNYH